MARAADYRRPNKFLLTSRPASKGVDPLHKWRRFKTMEEAEAAAESARRISGEKKKSPVRETYQKPERKPYHSDQIAGAETVPLRVSETVPLSISRVGTPRSEADGGAEPPPTPTCLPRTAVANARARWRAPPECPSGPRPRTAAPRLGRPFVREMTGAEARLRRDEINAADRNAQGAGPVRRATIH